jgi:hypothetical protein
MAALRNLGGAYYITGFFVVLSKQFGSLGFSVNNTQI